MVMHFADLKTGSNIFRFLKEHLKTVHLIIFMGYLYIFVFQIYAKKNSRLFTVPHENFINEEVKIKDPETLRDVLLVMKIRSFSLSLFVLLIYFEKKILPESQDPLFLHLLLCSFLGEL